MIKKKKHKKYYKIVVYTNGFVPIIRKQVFVNVVSLTESGGELYIKRHDETGCKYDLSIVADYIVKPQKGII